MNQISCDKAEYGECKYCGTVNYARHVLVVSCLNTIVCGKCKMPLN